MRATDSACARRSRAAAACAAVSFGVAVLLAADRVQAQMPQLESQARIVVTGDGSVSLRPDYAEIRAGVTTRGPTAKVATDANSKLMAGVTAALRNSGIEQKDVQTSEFSIEPIYTQPQPNADSKLSGFRVANQVEVKIRQIADVGEILDRLIAAGATDLSNVAFLHSDVSTALDRARTAAVADARRKAQVYAQAAGVSLGRVVWLTEDSGYAPPGPMGAMRAAGGLTAVPISSGEDTLHVRIVVGFDIAH
jgi:hypothetical protein